jgi:acyl-CoA synthetase (AMP-forming)/AMP-acid ligase II
MDAMLATIKRKPPTLFFGVPTLFIAMNALDDAKIPNLSGLRACISGAARCRWKWQTFEQRTGAGDLRRRPDRSFADRHLQPGGWRYPCEQLWFSGNAHRDPRPGKS